MQLLSKGNGEAHGEWWLMGWKSWWILVISCWNCGSQIQLKRHAISAEGKVNPAVNCPACTMTELVELEDWGGEIKTTYQIGIKRYGDDDSFQDTGAGASKEEQQATGAGEGTDADTAV